MAKKTTPKSNPPVAAKPAAKSPAKPKAATPASLVKEAPVATVPVAPPAPVAVPKSAPAKTVAPAKAAAAAPKAKKVVKKAAPKEIEEVAPKAPSYTQEDVALRAYFISEKRRSQGLPGDEHQDWLEAERQVSAESLSGKKKSKKA